MKQKLKNKLNYNNIGKLSGILLILIILFIMSYQIIANFIIYINIDNHLILHHVYDNNINIGDRICAYENRFLPLQYFDWNILRIFNKDIRYLLFPFYITIKFLITVFIFIYIIKDFEKFNKVKLNFPIKLLFVLFFLIYWGNAWLIMEIKFSEITQGLFSLLFILFYQRAYFINKPKYYVMAILSCVYATYMKETMFIPFLVIGIANLLFLDRNKNKLRWVNLLLILNGIVYITLYYFLVYKICNGEAYYKYANEQILFQPFYLFHFLIFFSVIRGYSFLKKRKIEFYDSFLLGADAFVFVMYIILNFKWIYYYHISYIFLCVFLIYYITKCSKYMKYFICFLMLSHILINIEPSYNYYKIQNIKRKIGKSFIYNFKDNDIINLYNNEYYDNIFKAYHKYIFNKDKNIINFGNYANEEVINKIIKLPTKEYIVMIKKNDNKRNLFNNEQIKQKYHLYEINTGNPIIYDMNTFLLSSYNY